MKMWWSADLLIILLWCFSLPIASGVSDYKHFHWQKLFSSDKDLLFQSPRRNVCGHLLSPFDHVGRLRCDNTSSDKGKKHFRMEYRDEDLVQGGFGEVELHSDRFSIYNVLHEQAVEKRTSEPLLYSWWLPASVCESAVHQPFSTACAWSFTANLSKLQLRSLYRVGDRYCKCPTWQRVLKMPVGRTEDGPQMRSDALAHPLIFNLQLTKTTNWNLADSF